MQRPLRIFCVFSRLLGGNTFSNALVEKLDKLDGVAPEYLFYENDDYHDYPAPAYTRISSTLESAWRIRKKFRKNGVKNYDAIFFQAYELILPFRRELRKSPVALALDTTPVLAHRLIIRESKSIVKKIRSWFLIYVSKIIYRPYFRRIDIFLPRSQWCANSLIEDFGINAKNIHVTNFIVSLQDWVPRDSVVSERPVLLFVGNDLARKGGDFVLEVFTKYLADTCKLLIVSNDPRAKLIKQQPNLEVVTGLTHADRDRLIFLYQTSDIFLFPSFRDQFGIAIGEAIATGLPVIARDVGAAGELVIDGYNGKLLPYSGTEKHWADAVIALISDSDRVHSYGSNSRALAEEKFSEEVFSRLLNATIQSLGEILESRANL